jgi:HEPN domain-containing protein
MLSFSTSGGKYLKAVLQENGSAIPRIHSLAELLALITKIDESFIQIQESAIALEGYAVHFRYPGLSADKSDAKAALSASKQICAFAREKLGW